jgi:hypothetical protein
MTPLYTIARDIDQVVGGFACRDALEASTFDHSRVVWRFLAAVLREMKPAPAKVQAVIDPVIAGMDRRGRGEEWPEARAAERAAQAVARAVAFEGAWAAARAARAASEASWAAARAARAAWAAWAAKLAARAGVSRETQRDILLRLIQEASRPRRTPLLPAWPNGCATPGSTAGKGGRGMTPREMRLNEIQRIISDHSSLLPKGFAADLNEQFAAMMADDAWEDDDELPSLTALRAFVSALIEWPTDCRPGIGTNGRGSITAYYRVGGVRHTYDFLPSGRVGAQKGDTP